MAAANYYPVIFRAVSGLPSNTHAARLGLYGQARKALAAQPLSKRELKRELRALEHAIREVERSPDQIPGERGSLSLCAAECVMIPQTVLCQRDCAEAPSTNAP
jgi:hypothetical protein